MSRPSWLRPALLWPVPVIAIAALLLIPRLRGPELPGYRVESRPLVQTVVATGRVISTSRVQVGSEVTGTVRERRVKEGDAVKPGDVLVVLSADDLVAAVREAEAALSQLQSSTRPQAEAALRQAEAQAAQAARERQRRADLFARQLIARELLEQAEEAEAVARAAADSARLAADAAAAGGSVEMQLRERLAAARAKLAKTTIRAQTSGVVLTRNVEPGDLVQPGRVLFEIARDGDTEIEVPVDEKNLAVLALGQIAQCIADAYPDKPFAAVVNYLAPGHRCAAGHGDHPPAGRSGAGLPAAGHDGVGECGDRPPRRALAVPNDALLDAAGAQPAVLAVRDGRLTREPVQLGLKGLVMTEVTERSAGRRSGAGLGGIREGRGRRRPGARGARRPAGRQRGCLLEPGTARQLQLTGMWIESTIAMRFLREGRAQTTLILVGIAVGVSVIVFITALIQGLQSNIIERTLGTQSHIKVEAPDEVNRRVALPADTTQLVLETRRAQRLRSINNWQQVMATLDAFPGVKAVSPVVSGPAFARRGNAVESVALVGMDPVRYQRIIPIGEDIVAGSLRVGAGDAVIGRLLADDLGIRVGDKFRLVAGDGREAQMNIAGIFELGVRELDQRYVYLDLKQAQSLLDLPGGVTVIDLTVNDLFGADAVAARIAQLTGLKTESWMPRLTDDVLYAAF